MTFRKWICKLMAYPWTIITSTIGRVLEAAQITDNFNFVYKSGTFAPTFAGDGTAGTPVYVTQKGKYVKMGALVIAQFAVEISAKTGMVGNLIVGGMPFTTSATITNPASGMIAYQHGLTYSGGYSALGLETGSGVTFCQVVQHGSNVDSLFLPISGVAASANLYGTAIYMTDD